MQTDNIWDELQWRGLLYDATDGLAELVKRESITLYNGFDPTADSLHVGNLLAMVQLARFQRFGHHPIALAGGGTGMIGDPSGRSTERNLLSDEQVRHNVSCIEQQLASVLDFDNNRNPARVVNNADWLQQLGMIPFLRDVGKHFTVSYMTGKESVQSRLDREDGLSYTEFSYMLLQAYDFLHLQQTFGCHLQTGGSDQWGNITAGTTLIRKKTGETAHGLVYPLLLRSDGTKFGKTAAGESVWLDPKRTSPYRFYQFFFNVDDDQVLDMLRFYTFVDREAIDGLAESVAKRPHLREAQRRLAQEVTRMVHGDGALARAERASSVLFGGSLEGLDADEIGDIFSDVPSTSVPLSALQNGGMSIVDLVAATTLVSSKSEARRQVDQGAVNINNERVHDQQRVVTVEDAIDGRYVVLRRGKRKYHLVRFTA